MKGEIVVEKPTKKEILRDSLKKINYYLTKAVVTEKEVYEVYKTFFSKYYELNYEFSAQELLMELDKVYIEDRVKQYYEYIAKKISVIEYKDNSLPDNELKEILELLKQVVEYLIKNEPKIKKDFLKKIRSYFKKN